MRNIRIIVITILVLFSLVGISYGADTTAPMSRNQAQNPSDIHPGESAVLSAQGKDDVALDWAWLSTNESGTWQSFKQWWNFNWGYSKKISIDHTKVQADLQNFPVLVSVTSPCFITHAQTSGDDFVFIDSTNTTKLNHEIESYNNSTGELAAWVNIPLLSSIEDTVLYLYYGNPSCGSQQNAVGTWNSDFLMVHHMTGAASTQMKDSTVNHWDITSQTGTPSYNQPGQVGKCVGFSPSASASLQTNLFRLPADSSYTASAWVRVSGGIDSRRTVFESPGYATSLQVYMSNLLKVTIKNTIGDYFNCDSTTSPNFNTWYYVCQRVDTTNDLMEILVNGVTENSVSFTGSLVPETQWFNIGANKNNSRYWMDGRIDELRVSNIPRSNAWIKTEYIMIASPESFLTLSTELTPGQITKYGSPMKLQQNTEWQWSNFSWQNPIIPQGTVVGWRITYQDAEGNTNQTNIMKFRVLGNPPAIPQTPEGPGTGTIGGMYNYSVVTTDPDGDTVAYFVDWGDESQSIWTSFVASGTPVVLSHSWQAPGTYAIKVKAKDVYGAQTSWSSTTMIVIYSSPLPALTLTAPSSVVEGASFDVTVTSAGTPMDHALVKFEETTLFTNSTGGVTFIAPEVQSTCAKPLSAHLSGYQSTTTTITVFDTGTSEETKGWVYGWVANTTGGFLKNARVCILQARGNATTLCGFTDTQGRYNFQILPGVYTIEVSKNGYETASQINVIVQKNHALEVNLILQSSTNQKPSPPSDENRDLIEAVIHAGIVSEKIAGELNVQSATNDYSLTVYKQDLTAVVVSMNQSEVMITVTATDIPGTIFVVRLYGQQNVTDVAVAVDGASIIQVGFSQIFEHEGAEPMYARVIDTSGEKSITYCLVYLPHFSSHEISITTIMETVQAFGGIIAVAVYIVIAVIVMVVLIMPVIMIERKRP